VRSFAKTLSVELELVVFDTAGKSVHAVSEERADFGFFVVDALRGEKIAITAPYVLTDGFYLIRNDSPVKTNEDVVRRTTALKMSCLSYFGTFQALPSSP